MLQICLLCLLLSLTACVASKTVNVQGDLPFCIKKDHHEINTPADTQYTKLFRVKSKILSRFWNEDVFIEAGVILPPGYRKSEKLAAGYYIHGFGGDHTIAWKHEQYLTRPLYHRLIYVYPNASFKYRHHSFVNSENNGPWADAFVKEFIPALEKEFGVCARPECRLLSGHSSGAWSALWLQVNYPEFFGGVWAKSPDPVDFRDFSGINLYTSKSMFIDAEGRPRKFIRHDDRWLMTFSQYVDAENSQCPGKDQMATFNYLFSSKGKDGKPELLYDYTTGLINKKVLEHWKKYDITLILKNNWPVLGPKLKGKLHLYMGSLDQFRLEGAAALLKKELETLGSDAQIIIVPDRGHVQLGSPHPEYWPNGIYPRIHMEMVKISGQDR